MFAGRLIVITGGSSGLGRALAERLSGLGARLALVARNVVALESAKKSIEAASPSGSGVGIFPCDVTDPRAVEKTMKAVANDMGPPDILINSAGILRETHFERESLGAFHDVMDTNFFGALHCIRAVLPFFLRTDRGRIVNIGSVAGLLGVFGYSAYCSAKHALRGLTEAIWIELEPYNITVHLVLPPEFRSPMVERLDGLRSAENLMMAHTIPVLGTDAVADSVITGIIKNRYEIIPGLQTRAVIRASRWFPSLVRTVMDLRLRLFNHGRSSGSGEKGGRDRQ